MPMETTFLGTKLKNPLVLASGVLGTSLGSMKSAAKGGAGAVTIKSISVEERMGHKNPAIIASEHWMMNAVGYSNPGMEKAKEQLKGIEKTGVPVIGSATGKNAEEFARVVKELDSLPFIAWELPLSCPHTPGFGLLAGQGTPEFTAKVTSKVKKSTKKPVIVKLSPNVTGIGGIAKAAEKAGADALCVANSLGPGMHINIEAASPVLDFKAGGVSGYALHPIAVRCVYDVFESVKIPIIGLGGVASGRDAIEMLMAGASAVGVGSAVHWRGANVFRDICAEMQAWMKENGFKKIQEMKGIAHK